MHIATKDKWRRLAPIFSGLLAAAALCSAAPAARSAEPAFATRRVEIVVSAAAGATTDILGRLIAEKLAPRIGHPVIVINKPGANQQIGADFVSRAAPDGHTLLLSHSALVANPVMFKAVKMDMNRDLTPIAQLVSTPWVFSVPDQLPVRTVGEFIAYAKANPDKVNFGSTGGTVTLDTKVFMARAGIEAEIVNYAGGAPLVAALATNEVQAALSSVRSVNAMAGRVRLLAVTSPTRSALVPDLPTVAESALPGFEGASLWFGLWAPAGMAPELAQKINREVNTILSMADVKQRIVDTMTCDIVGGPAEELRRAVATDLDYYRRAAQAAKLAAQ
ncbi:tripartite tricarboxylate transporter substrate-binding protein [Xylophilus sp. GW821-FHT01B05]